MGKVLIIEPFYGGSHKDLIDFITNLLSKYNVVHDLVTLPAKKWHWRARTSALYFYKTILREQQYNLIFCSSVLNLAEVIALRNDLRGAKTILYFHENQFIYPKQKEKDRDFQYGYNTILSALVADFVIFNSYYNQKTFLDNISKHIKKQPDFRVSGIAKEIEPKCKVIYFPVEVPKVMTQKNYEILHIVWPHRWEHDKNPELFFSTLFKLKESGLKFFVSVLGQSFTDSMPIFDEAQKTLEQNILHFGRLKSKDEYFSVLSNAHVVVSTAEHEFFGVAMLEAVKCGCYLVAPNNLVYPEIYPEQCLYNTPQQLFKKLKDFCRYPEKTQNLSLSLEKLQIGSIESEFVKIFDLT